MACYEAGFRCREDIQFLLTNQRGKNGIIEINFVIIVEVIVGESVKFIIFCYNKLPPLGDRVAVERVEEKTTSGIIIPDTAKEKPVQGKIVACGEGARDESGKRIPLDVKVGDIVLFTKWGGTEFKIDGREITILKESDILAILGKSSSVKAA